MKISVLTPTYNRANLIERLYNSLVQNSNCGVEIEWLIMDDGSKNPPKEKVQKFITENKIQIKYFEQENKGKMEAINNLVSHATGDLIVDCDDDDYFTENAFEIIKKSFEENINEKDCYAMCFLKYNQDKKNMGNLFKNPKTTMFDLYFKEGEDGEKAVVFFSNIRKKYKHELVNNEKFVTEARMYHKMDLNYKMICINEPIMICEYQKEGYTKNIINQFKQNPYGYYEYFKEIFEHNMNGVAFSKRLYVIKHFILFTYLTKTKKSFQNVKGFFNKILYILLYIPGVAKTRKMFNKKVAQYAK